MHIPCPYVRVYFIYIAHTFFGRSPQWRAGSMAVHSVADHDKAQRCNLHRYSIIGGHRISQIWRTAFVI